MRAGWRGSCASTPSGCSRCDRQGRPVRASGGRLDGACVRGRHGVPRASSRADRRRSGRRLEPGDEVLDLACGDGALGEALLARGLRYRGVDSTPEMVDAARGGSGRARPIELGDLNDYAPPARSRRRRSFARSTTRATAARSSSARRVHAEEARVRSQPAAVPARGRGRGSPCAGFAGRAAAVLRPADRLAPRPGSRRRQGARAQRPARAPRAPCPLHLPRRGLAQLPKRGWKPARSMAAPRSAVLALRRIDLDRREGRRDRDLHAPGDVGRAQRRPVRLAVGHVEPPRLRDVLDPRLVVGPDPHGTDPDRHLAGAAEIGISGTSRSA